MMEEECSLTNNIGQTTQIVLAFLVLIVLTLEYLWERIWAWRNSTQEKRDKIQFVYDVFKISCGSAVSHLYNVLVSMWMSADSALGNECGLYAIAFVYEASGVCFVQLQMYCLIKFAESRSFVSPNWRIISKPGQYNTKWEDISEQFFPSSTFWLRIFVSLVLSSVSLSIGLSLGFSNAMTFVGPVLVFFLCFSFLYTSFEARLQTVAWVSIKFFEKSVWSMFAIAQAPFFRRWSLLMGIKGHPELEAIWYICLIPMIMNSIIFYFLSKISRLELPCVLVEERSNVEEQFFDLPEAVQVGIVFAIYMNLVIWIFCCIALRDWEVVGVLFVSIVMIPVAMAIIFIWIARHFVEKSYAMYGSDQKLNFLNEDEGVDRNVNPTFDITPIDFSRNESRENLHKDGQLADLPWGS